ncbi:MAG: stimulus-sensing domain-containing protein [Alphaproteobacteria bacterium]|nr:stimulus-sensing domain-containing protein [Alphaproteobacteria bacterium]
MTIFNYTRPTPHSRLRRLIIIINIVTFLLLIAGVFAVQSSREGLVDERLTGVEEQARIVANTLAEYATASDTRSINVDDAAPLLRELLAPTRLRGRLYDTDGQLVIDTRNLLARNIVQTMELPPIDGWSRFKQAVAHVYDNIIGVRPFVKLAPYFEAGKNGKVYSEVDKALEGDTSTAERVDEQNKLVLSVAVPIQRFRAIYGVLFVSTEGGDIDDILRQERATLIMYFLLAFAVMLVSGLILSGTIAEPMRKLAEAADRVRRGRTGRETLPDMSYRNDEIGDLSQSLSSMTHALYDRIDAIESFAADVAHELKNPLTSLKSAVEMFSRATDDKSRARLLEIIRADVKRIDRLITDISDASRLDAELSRETSELVDLSRLLETIVEVYNLTEHPRGVKAVLDLHLPPDALVIGRNERLGQIVRNLIDNALSFSRDGGIVTVSARAEYLLARIMVEDEGPGIPSDNLETVFERFYTERPAEQDFGKNSGLGLSIARQIATGLGGRIWAENREQGGARFIVELPLTRAL